MIEANSRRESLSTFAERWNDLNDMEEQVVRKGFDEGVVLGHSTHEIRAVTAMAMHRNHFLAFAGDKDGVLYGGLFGRDGVPDPSLPWQPIHAIPSLCVIDTLTTVRARGGQVVVGTRGNGTWVVPTEEIVAAPDNAKARLLEGTDGRTVRRLLYDSATDVLWASADNHLLAWHVAGPDMPLIHDIELNGRVTAMTIDGGRQPAADHLYLATNLSTLHLFKRGPDGRFEVSERLHEKDAVWRGRSSVIETLIPMSAFQRADDEGRQWVPRFPVRGVAATTLRHIMTICHADRRGDDQEQGHNRPLMCDVRRVVTFSKVLATAPLSLPTWQGIAVSTLDSRIRIYRPTGVRQPDDDFDPYCENVPENTVPRSLLSGCEEIDFLQERVYDFAVLPDDSPSGLTHIPIILGMGNHTVRYHLYTVGWNVRRVARDLARKTASALPADDVLASLEEATLHPNVVVREKYAASVMIPEIGELCQKPDQWERLRLLIWDVLSGSESLPKIPVHVVQSLRRLQRTQPARREELEETIFAIRKHIFDRRSFSEKPGRFLERTRSRDPHLADDRIVYQSILISRRHDPVFAHTFDAKDNFGEIRCFEILAGTEADSPRFVAGTYRKTIWVLAGLGAGEVLEPSLHTRRRARRIEGNDPDWGYPLSAICNGEWTVFGFSGGGIYRVRTSDLLKAADESDPRAEFEEAVSFDAAVPTCFCLCPDEGAHCLIVGDSDGGLGILRGRTYERLQNLSSTVGLLQNVAVQTTVVEAFTCSIRGRVRRFVVAGSDLGYLFLFEYESGRLDFVNRIRVATASVTSLLILGDAVKQVVAGCSDGRVVGSWLLDSEDGPSLQPYWGFEAGDSVRCLRYLPARSSGIDSGYDLIAIGSHDEHLHIVDHAGRHRETIFMRGVKVDRFAAFPADDPDEAIECVIYACGFENSFHCLRLVSRTALMSALQASLDGMTDAKRELSLSRWRSFAIQEGHLRHRFVRQSSRYPGPSPNDTVREIRRVLAAGDNAEQWTGVVTALLRRLFQNHFPGERTTSSQATGTRVILTDPNLYADVVHLLTELEEQWNTPGSVSNRRVQYFWIRSLLRGIQDVDMLRQWSAVAQQTPDVEKAAPAALLYHFLEHTSDLIQFKVLQRLERMLFGWPAVSQCGVLMSAESIQRSDIDWILTATMPRLRLSPSQVSAEEPNFVILQIGKILCHLLRIGYLDSLYLADLLQRHHVPSEMCGILAGQCKAMADPGAHAALRTDEPLTPVQQERLNTAARVIEATRNLETSLTQGSIEGVGDSIAIILAECRSAEQSDYRDFLVETARYYGLVGPLLGVTRLDDIAHLNMTFPETTSTYYRTSALLSGFQKLIAQLKRYRIRKLQDIWERPLEALEVADFDRPRSTWRELHRRLLVADESVLPIERLLLRQIADKWAQILDDEQKNELLQDLVATVERIVTSETVLPRNNAEAMSRLATHHRLMEVAFANLFLRLVLSAEPAHAAFAEREKDGSIAQLRMLVRDGGIDIVNVSPDQAPPWLIDRLEHADPEDYGAADERGIRWRTIVTKEVGEGVYPRIFAFGFDQRTDASQFNTLRITALLVVHALVFRQVSMQQQALEGRIFSMVAHNLGSPVYHVRSHARVLADGRMDAPERRDARFAKYHEILRQGRHMQGVIDAILSFDGRETKLELSEISLAELTYEVVRTMRPEAKGKVEIDFEKPDAADVKKTIFLTDEIRLYDVLLNLVGNAIKYSPFDSAVRVHVSVKENHGAEFRIRDYGPGIPNKERDEIFEPFFRGRYARESGVPGLGLGLNIARLYVTALGGRISFNNEDGGGTTFIIFLPAIHQKRGATRDDGHTADRR